MVGCILHVLHVCNPWLTFIYIHQINTVLQTLYFVDTYLRYLFITSLNVDSNQNTWYSESPPSMTTWDVKGITLFNNRSSSLVLLASISIFQIHLSLFQPQFPSFKFFFFSLWCDCVIALFSEYSQTLTF